MSLRLKVLQVGVLVIKGWPCDIFLSSLCFVYLLRKEGYNSQPTTGWHVAPTVLLNVRFLSFPTVPCLKYLSRNHLVFGARNWSSKWHKHPWKQPNTDSLACMCQCRIVTRSTKDVLVNWEHSTKPCVPWVARVKSSAWTGGHVAAKRGTSLSRFASVAGVSESLKTKSEWKGTRWYFVRLITNDILR